MGHATVQTTAQPTVSFQIGNSKGVSQPLAVREKQAENSTVAGDDEENETSDGDSADENQAEDLSGAFQLAEEKKMRVPKIPTTRALKLALLSLKFLPIAQTRLTITLTVARGSVLCRIMCTVCMSHGFHGRVQRHPHWKSVYSRNTML